MCFSKTTDFKTEKITYTSFICKETIHHDKSLIYVVCLYKEAIACNAKECVQYAESRSCQPINIKENYRMSTTWQAVHFKIKLKTLERNLYNA